MPQYAENTDVTMDRSKAEIERTLVKYGATQFGYAWKGDKAIIGFTIQNRQVQYNLPLPDRNSKQFTHHSRGPRSESAAQKEWEQACRQRWRALALIVKAKLEGIECGISTVEREFLADILLPNGQTVGEWTQPQIERAYLENKMPPLLLLGGN